MSLKRRIAHNSAANAVGIGWTAVLQLVSVPVLVSVWGLDKYGVWLMLTTIPTYFALTDLGFAAAATSDMTMAIARGDKEGALVTLQSVWLMLLSIGIAATLLVSPFLWLPWVLPEMPGWWPQESTVLFLLVVYSAAVLCSRVVLAGFRCSGHYAVGTMTYDAMVFVEGMLLLLVAWLHGSFVACALTFIVARFAIIAFQSWRLNRQVPYLHIGLRHAHMPELRRLFKPAVAAMAIPTAQALNIHGMLLVTGAVISPAAVAVLNPVRTASRIAVQAVGIVNRATMPEYSAASATGDRHGIQRVLRLNMMSLLFVLLPGAIAFALFGRSFVIVWTRGHVEPENTFVLLMALAMFLQGLWFFAGNLLLAINRHVGFSFVLAPAAVLSVLVAIPAGHAFGLNGIGMSVVLSEFICVCAFLYYGLRQLL